MKIAENPELNVLPLNIWAHVFYTNKQLFFEPVRTKVHITSNGKTKIPY